MKKWQLLVYFQLRFREIIKDVEDVLNDPKKSLAREGGDDMIFVGGKVILTSIKQCWSDDIFLYGLSHRFWKLTLQLIKRYNNWIVDTFKV